MVQCCVLRMVSPLGVEVQGLTVVLYAQVALGCVLVTQMLHVACAMWCVVLSCCCRVVVWAYVVAFLTFLELVVTQQH
ncbi:hypothetical protein COO60DRAFT_1698655 [Scenedesmus sp. NREL 46B-D3]|nr:hypothetical protein COO60DRAFT_1698655 [Scenedesmus sp. NREL 46B-D3]